MCEPGKPCDDVLAAVRGALEPVVVDAIASVVVQCVLIGHHRLTPEQLAHVHQTMGTRSAETVGRALALALVAERIPDVQELRDATLEVRAALLRKVFTTPARVPAFRVVPDA